MPTIRVRYNSKDLQKKRELIKPLQNMDSQFKNLNSTVNYSKRKKVNRFGTGKNSVSSVDERSSYSSIGKTPEAYQNLK